MPKLIKINGILKQRPEIQGEFADDNIIYPFKGRTIDTDFEMQVYRNLNKKGIWYSIKQRGLVVAHSSALCLRDVEFVVNNNGKQRAIDSGERNVHAFLVGKYDTSGMGTTAKKNDLPVKVKYNPFDTKGFYFNWCGKSKEIKKAWFVIANSEGVKASYVS